MNLLAALLLLCHLHDLEEQIDVDHYDSELSRRLDLALMRVEAAAA